MAGDGRNLLSLLIRSPLRSLSGAISPGTLGTNPLKSCKDLGPRSLGRLHRPHESDEQEAADEISSHGKAQIREQLAHVHVGAVPHPEDELDRADDRVVEGPE